MLIRITFGNIFMCKHWEITCTQEQLWLKARVLNVNDQRISQWIFKRKKKLKQRITAAEINNTFKESKLEKIAWQALHKDNILEILLFQTFKTLAAVFLNFWVGNLISSDFVFWKWMLIMKQSNKYMFFKVLSIISYNFFHSFC